MPVLARITLVSLVAYTALSMVFVGNEGLVTAYVGPINVNLFDLLLLVAATLLVREATLEHGQRIPPANRIVVALVLGYCAYQIAVILTVSVVFHGLEPIAVARQLESRYAIVLILFVYLVGLKYMSPYRLVAWVNAAAVFLVFVALYRFVTGFEMTQGDTADYFLRMLWGGATLLFGFLILTSLFLRRPSSFAYVMALVGLTGIVLTNSRSAYVALIATVPPLLINSRRAATRTIVIALVVASAALIVVTVSPVARNSVIYSLRTMANPTADRNAQDRVDRSVLAWDYFVAHPLGDYTWSQRYYLVDVGADAFEPHNFVAQLLGQQGIVGFAFFAGLIVATARIAWRNRRRDRMSAVMLAYFAFYLIFCLFNTNLLYGGNILLLIVPVGLILARNAALPEADEEAQLSETGETNEWLLPSRDVLQEGSRT